jgi:glyoxylase-like metal-dependent hydrolase (beta-lactamase superfamily II)/ferredoxin
MARISQRRPENVEGNFYVDHTCIDCDTCRWMAPSVFHRANGQSAVYHQPTTPEEHLRAMQALLACPTASIGTVQPAADVKSVQKSFPIPITDDVYHCGYHSEQSFGAASYFIQRPDGNVLVDSPRFAAPLVKQLEAMGGIRYLYLTHRDDVADHQKFHDHFGCDRILHQDDVSAGTRTVEHQLSGHDPIQFAPDLLIIPVPGHTKGHTVLLFRNTVLFTGDHLAWSAELQHLFAFRRACWYSWTELFQSMKTLAQYSFEWVLPGHGRSFHGDRQTMQEQMETCLDWMARN